MSSLSMKMAPSSSLTVSNLPARSAVKKFSPWEERVLSVVSYRLCKWWMVEYVCVNYLYTGSKTHPSDI